MNQTFNFDIKAVDDKDYFDQILYDQTGLYYRIHSNPSLITNEFFVEDCLLAFNCDKTIFDYAVKDVEMMWSSEAEIKKEKDLEANEVNGRLRELKAIKNLTDNQKREKKNLLKKLCIYNRNKKKGICFGGKETLRQITKIKQKSTQTKKDKRRLRKLEKEFFLNRERNIFLWGKSAEGGNRKVDFYLEDNYIILKMNKKKHLRIDLVPQHGKKRTKTVAKIQEMINNDEIPVTIRVCRDKICVSFDNEILSGYSLDVQGFNEAVKNNPGKPRKEIRQEFREIQTQKKLENKITKRVAGIDDNPHVIGFSICDVDSEDEVKSIIERKGFDISYYTMQKNLSKKDREKFQFELVKIFDYIIKQCNHYKVAYFGFEELKGITNNPIQTNSTYFNRITKNVWYRTLKTNLIKVRCDEYGIIWNEVDPKYSSFIGNIKQNIYDPIAASTEIGRRAKIKYLPNKGNRIFPSINTEDYERMIHLIGHDVSNIKTWKSLKKVFDKKKNSDKPDNGGWWRNKSCTVGNYLYTEKSNVRICY